MRNVYLIQVNWENCSGNTPGYWIPYSAGSVWAYSKTVPEISSQFILKDILFKRDRIPQVVNRLETPDVVGFSNYVWNEQYNLELARNIKRQWPNTLIVFGGPQVPNSTGAFFSNHGFIDILVHSEGELAFAQLLLERLETRPNYLQVPGCTINVGGRPVETGPTKRIRRLEKLPSPYLSGVFDGLLEQHPDAVWNAVMETNRGCPYRCSFCDWGTLTYSKLAKFDLERVYAEIEWLARRNVDYVLPADANFGIFPERDAAIAEHFIACKHRYGRPSAVGMNFAKNSNVQIVEIASSLHKAHLLKALTLSTQSMTESVLDAIERRNMDFSNFADLLHRCLQLGIPTYTELILGLPLETYASWKAGLCECIEAGQHHQLESWLLELLVNAPLNSSKLIDCYGIKTAKLKNYSFVFDHKDTDEIPERIEIVYATSTMPFPEMQRSLGFSMIIYNLHAYGWTQFVARFLRIHHDVSFSEFYERLEDWIARNTDSLLHREYAATLSTFSQMIETGDFFVDRMLLDMNVGAVPLGLRSQGFLHLEPHRTLAEIAVFVNETFVNLPSHQRDEVLRFQTHFITAHDRDYPYIETFAFDFEPILRGEPAVQSQTAYRFDTVYPFETLKDYLSLIYSRKKQGFGKASIAPVPQIDLIKHASAAPEKQLGRGEYA